MMLVLSDTLKVYELRGRKCGCNEEKSIADLQIPSRYVTVPRARQ
jgi:hypothetical protein